MSARGSMVFTAVLVAGTSFAGSVDSIAVGDGARDVNSRLDAIARSSSSIFRLSGLSRMKEALRSLPTRYCSENWNGYGEKSLSRASYESAERFLDLLPAVVEEGEVGVDADGEVVLEWYKSINRMVSLCFGNNAKVYCISRTERGKATMTFERERQEDIIRLVGEVTGV